MNSAILRAIIISIIIAIILSIPTIFLFVLSDPEKHYMEAIRTWDKKPIFHISTTKINDDYIEYPLFNLKDLTTFCDCTFVDGLKSPYPDTCDDNERNLGCIEYAKKEAYKYQNLTFYVKYFNLDYYDLFDRVKYTDKKNYKERDRCNRGYTQCGRMDLFGHHLCVDKNKGESCPISQFEINGNDISIGYSPESKIINQLYVSQLDYPTIFDINEIYTIRNIDKKNKPENNDYFYYNLTKLNSQIRQDEFINQNDLIDVGKCPSKFEKYYFYLYHLVYPSNLKEYEMTKFLAGLINYRLLILIFYIIIRIGIFMILLLINDVKKLFIIILLDFFFLFILIFNILYIKGRYRLNMILDEYNTYYYFYKLEFFPSFWDCFIIYATLLIDIIILGTSNIIIFCNKKKEKNEELLNKNIDKSEDFINGADDDEIERDK